MSTPKFLITHIDLINLVYNKNNIIKSQAQGLPLFIPGSRKDPKLQENLINQMARIEVIEDW